MSTQEGYHYTGTVNIWTKNGIVNSGVVQAWNELQSVPSYIERFTDGRARFDDSDVRYALGEPCDCCNRQICVNEE